jgi:hypothetical protein
MQSDTEFVEGLEQIAERHAAALESLTPKDRKSYVRDAMKGSKVVFAIWYAGNERHCYCIKGMATPEGAKVATTAFIVGSAADAEGMKVNWGDGPSKPSSMN